MMIIAIGITYSNGLGSSFCFLSYLSFSCNFAFLSSYASLAFLILSTSSSRLRSISSASFFVISFYSCLYLIPSSAYFLISASSAAKNSAISLSSSYVYFLAYSLYRNFTYLSLASLRLILSSAIF